jgi:hypothetical protein
MKRKICILGTYHGYQIDVSRPGYVENVRALLKLHCVDLIAEEATGAPSTYAQGIAAESQISWKNVDLTKEERGKVPDVNPDSIGTLLDFDLQTIREWVWVVRTSKAMKDSALLICGLTHALSVAEKFRWVGFDIETNVYFPRADENRIKNG